MNAANARQSGRPRAAALLALLAAGSLVAPSAAQVGAAAPAAPSAFATGGGTAVAPRVPSPSGIAPAADPVYIPDISKLLPAANSRESLSASLQVVVILTLLTVLPSIVLMMTCFVRMVIVLVLLRQALGTATLPPSQVLVGLALFLTMLVMAPTWGRIYANAIQPYLNGEQQQMEAIGGAADELRHFMFDQIEAAGNERDVYMLYEYAERTALSADAVLTRQDVPMTALAPAFMLSELKVAFVLGFRIYLPFLVIDMVIATVLVAMGMMMLPPVLISLPFKLLLFVLADGWHLIAGSLMASVA